MKKRIVYILLISTLVISACKNNSEQSINEPEVQTYVDSILCKNQLKLISNDTLPVVKLDLTKSLDSCILQVQQSFDFDLCNRKVYYSIPYDLKTKTIQQTENSILLKLRLYKRCGCFCCNDIRCIWILMNEKSDVLINGNIVKYENINNLDSIIQYHYLYDEFPLYEQPESSFIGLMWDKEIDVDKLTALFNDIINGYFLTISEYSNNKFHKTICELSDDEINLLRDSIPFEFELLFQWEKAPPLPEEENLIN